MEGIFYAKNLMHVISRKALQKFWEKYPNSESSLSHWFKAVKNSDFLNFNDLRLAFPSADRVDDLIVFNISGNKYRLIASVHFKRGKVYIRHLLTHSEYDRGVWKK